jgi:ParB family chromosome partitioning protein
LIEGALTVRQAEQRSPKKKPGGKPTPDPNVTALEADISSTLGLKTQITHKVGKSGDKGEVRVTYSSLEQLDEIVRRLMKR